MRGGSNAVRAAIGIGYLPLKRGFQELENPSDDQRLRKTGGGRKKKTVHDTTLLSDLQLIVDPLTRGDPMISMDTKKKENIGHYTEDTRKYRFDF